MNSKRQFCRLGLVYNASSIFLKRFGEAPENWYVRKPLSLHVVLIFATKKKKKKKKEDKTKTKHKSKVLEHLTRHLFDGSICSNFEKVLHRSVESLISKTLLFLYTIPIPFFGYSENVTTPHPRKHWKKKTGFISSQIYLIVSCHLQSLSRLVLEHLKPHIFWQRQLNLQ